MPRGRPSCWNSTTSSPTPLDRIAIEQVLVNLVRNALDAMQTPGSARRVLTIRSSRAGDTLEVAVVDTGCGLSAAARAHMFDPFFTTKSDGLGMGLPISRNIVEAHQGRLWAEPSSAGGAAFRFALPLSGA